MDSIIWNDNVIKIGDRVSVNGTIDGLNINSTGTVVEIGFWSNDPNVKRLGINWDNISGYGHNCNGHARQLHGWRVPEFEFYKLKFQKNSSPNNWEE